jgi:hypothetical protein
MNPDFYILKSIPDDRCVMLRPRGWEALPVPMTPGNAGFFGGVPKPNARNITFGAREMKFAQPLLRRPCVNYMADADVHSLGLAQAAGFVEQLKTPCFNAPAAVRKTTRDGVCRLLGGIDAFEIPLTVRVRSQTWSGLREAVEKSGLRYPVIARMAGDQGAARTVRVEGPDDWEAINALPWGGHDLYLTQWVDYSEAGVFGNVRIALVGGEAFCCFVLEKGDWLLTPSDVEAADAKAGARRIAFEKDVLPSLRPALAEAAKRLQLDCFAIDGSLRPDGRLLVFEANASNPTRPDMKLAPLAEAVRKRLANPDSWWGRPA